MHFDRLQPYRKPYVDVANTIRVRVVEKFDTDDINEKTGNRIGLENHSVGLLEGKEYLCTLTGPPCPGA